MFFDSAEGREIDGSADVYPYVSRGNYIQSAGQATPLQTTDSLFPSFAAPGVATPAANTFLAVSQSPAAAKPLHAAVVARRAARAVREHDARSELHRHEGDEPADAAQHRAGAGVHAGPPDGGRAQAVSQLRRLHRQRLGRQVELQRLQHEAGASRPRLAADVCVYLGEEHRHQVRRGRHRRDRISTAGRAS